MIFTSEQLAQGTRGRLIAGGVPGRVCTDTRAIQAGDWFLAIRGERFDAHHFLDQAIEAGATGVIAEEVRPGWNAGYIKVGDGLTALQNIGRFVRNGFEGPVVGITGSAGKPTTRALVGLALADLGPIHQTAGNYNNHIGLPLTLLAAHEEASAWVLEMGMNHSGEIALLQEIGRPTIRLITNVGIAHLEGLGSIEAIAKAKGELFDGAQAGDICCINMDDPYVADLPIPQGVQTLGYGAHPDSDLRLLSAHVDPDSLHTHFEVQGNGQKVRGMIPNPGIHMAHNAVAAMTVGLALGLDLDLMAARIAQYAPVGMRLRIEPGPRGTKVINDAYNANPMSVEANLRMLAAIPAGDGRRRIALLGDMLELGPTEIEQHREVAEIATSLGLEFVAFAGPRFTEAVGTTHTCSPDAETLGTTIQDALHPGDIVLIKGSRGMAMERLLTTIALEETH
jgi:UDP-N-acetylmuramoyl-tripeptide--D-alanyl-D-alanine ligase